MAGTRDLRGCAAIEAMRAGVVNSHVVERVTCGRAAELRECTSWIEDHPEGSKQVVIGRYGVGKSHFCELVANALELKGYVTARLEMGASHGRAESPKSVVRSLEQAVRARHDRRLLRGVSEVRLLLWAMDCSATDDCWWDEIDRVHEEYPGPQNVWQRYDALRTRMIQEAEWQQWVGPQWQLLISRGLPAAMTAANCATAAVNRFAHELSYRGFKGLVVLFDEAERSEWAEYWYRADRARDLMIGFARVAANQDTGGLKHYRNEMWRPYRPLSPSKIHAIYLFTHAWGLARELMGNETDRMLQLAALSPRDRLQLERQIARLYTRSYGLPDELRPVPPPNDAHAADGEDVRALVRQVVASLDFQRYGWRNGRRR